MRPNETRPVRRASALAIGLATAVAFSGHASSDADEANPHRRANGTAWISVSGTVKSVEPDRVSLDYGAGVATVEIADEDRDAGHYTLAEGDRVTVHSRIGDYSYATRTIRAASLYVEKLGTYFYANPLDEKDVFFFAATTTPVVVSSAVVQGLVSEVGEESFAIDSGPRRLVVDVTRMTYDPLDADGYQRIRVGDVVRATGRIGEDFFEERRFEAASVVRLAL